MKVQGWKDMKSALEIVAFTHNTHKDGTVALLEVALSALEREEFRMSAALVEIALRRFLEEIGERPALYDGSLH